MYKVFTDELVVELLDTHSFMFYMSAPDMSTYLEVPDSFVSGVIRMGKLSHLEKRITPKLPVYRMPEAGAIIRRMYEEDKQGVPAGQNVQ